MSNPADNAARTQRFNDAVRAFTPPSPTRHAKLMPLKEGIVELRQKGASLRLIRELLATVDVAVGTDTIARFLADVNGEPPPQRAPKRSSRRRVVVAARNNGQTPTTPAITHQSKPAQPQQIETPAERPRTRGPRVADPRNL
jgi:plasmid stabilization system protein ParE